MSAENICTVMLPAMFTQMQLSGLKEIVNHHQDNGDIVQLDASDVERIDGAAVQFLLAVGKLQEQHDHSRELVVNTGDVVSNALNDMGLGDSVSFSAAQA